MVPVLSWLDECNRRLLTSTIAHLHDIRCSLSVFLDDDVEMSIADIGVNEITQLFLNGTIAGHDDL